MVPVQMDRDWPRDLSVTGSTCLGIQVTEVVLQMKGLR
jgi:hypothetical protein